MTTAATISTSTAPSPATCESDATLHKTEREVKLSQEWNDGQGDEQNPQASENPWHGSPLLSFSSTQKPHPSLLGVRTQLHLAGKQVLFHQLRFPTRGPHTHIQTTRDKSLWHSLFLGSPGRALGGT
jgi:hypothetical protein